MSTTFVIYAGFSGSIGLFVFLAMDLLLPSHRRNCRNSKLYYIRVRASLTNEQSTSRAKPYADVFIGHDRQQRRKRRSVAWNKCESWDEIHHYKKASYESVESALYIFKFYPNVWRVLHRTPSCSSLGSYAALTLLHRAPTPPYYNNNNKITYLEPKSVEVKVQIGSKQKCTPPNSQ